MDPDPFHESDPEGQNESDPNGSETLLSQKKEFLQFRVQELFPVGVWILDENVYLEDQLGRGLHEGLKQPQQRGVGVLVHHQRVVLHSLLQIICNI